MRKNREQALLTGVCAGIADSTGVDATLIRLTFALAFILFGAGPLVYLLLWIIMD